MCLEDTFILLDALEKDAETLRDLKPRICLEIGSEILFLCSEVRRASSTNLIYSYYFRQLVQDRAASLPF